MILSQEQHLLKAQAVLNRMFAMLQEAVASEKRIDLVEREIFAELLKIGLMTMEAFVSEQGDGDHGKTVEHNHKTLQRLPKAEKRYVSIFGELFVNRYAFGRRPTAFIPNAAKRRPPSFRITSPCCSKERSAM